MKEIVLIKWALLLIGTIVYYFTTRDDNTHLGIMSSLDNLLPTFWYIMFLIFWLVLFFILL